MKGKIMTTEKGVCGILQTAKLNLEQTAIRLKISDDMLNRLLEPKEKNRVNIKSDIK